MSDLVSVDCPNCGAKLKIRESTEESKRVRCPECHEAFVVEPPEDDPPPRARRRREPEPEEEPAEESPPPRKKRSRSARDEDEDDGGHRGKKKRQKQGSGQLLLLGLAVVGAFLLLGGVVLLFVLMPRGKKMTAPESYTTYQAPEGEFSCEVPADWALQETGIKNSRSITVKKGKASIHVRQSLAGSLLGDIAGAGQRDADPPDDRLPVSRVHEIKKAGVADEVGGKYTEEPAVTVMTKGFGKARRSSFTSAGTFSRARGYRATVLANMISYDVICQCAPEDWELLEPAFAKAIASLGHGTGR
jgi:hypothetical protein